MRRLLAVALVAVAAACGPRTATVQTGPTPATGVMVHVRNNLNEAVNIYVNSGGQDVFVGQVQANSTADLPVSGVASGSSATLRAKTNSGNNYSKQNVLMSGMVDYTVP
ncbi:MAG: hypothetical protein ABJD07_09215 [Gemmatimonadaceae bacterium]